MAALLLLLLLLCSCSLLSVVEPTSRQLIEIATRALTSSQSSLLQPVESVDIALPTFPRHHIRLFRNFLGGSQTLLHACIRRATVEQF